MGIVITPAAVLDQLAQEDGALNGLIENVNGLQQQISGFTGNEELQGEAYAKLKDYFFSIHHTITKGLIWYGQAKMAENAQYRNWVSSYWGGVARVDEEELEREKERIQEKMYAIERSGNNLEMLRYLQAQKRATQEELNRIYEYVNATNGYYQSGTANLILENVARMQKCMGKVRYNRNTGSFEGKWRESKDFLEGEDFLFKYGLVVEYERLHPADGQKVDAFLCPQPPLEPWYDGYDIIQIKYMLYSAPEEIRQPMIYYMDQYHITVIGGQEQSSFRGLGEDGVVRNPYLSLNFVKNIENDARGRYHALFHEMAHATDILSARDMGKKWFTSGNQVTLDQAIRKDVYNHLSATVEANSGETLSPEEKQRIIQFIMDGGSYAGGQDGMDALKKTKEQYQKLFKNKNNFNASAILDAFIGVTNHRIMPRISDLGHPVNYFNENTTPASEFYAETTAQIITGGYQGEGAKTTREIMPEAMAQREVVGDAIYKYTSQQAGG